MFPTSTCPAIAGRQKCLSSTPTAIHLRSFSLTANAVNVVSRAVSPKRDTRSKQRREKPPHPAPAVAYVPHPDISFHSISEFVTRSGMAWAALACVLPSASFSLRSTRIGHHLSCLAGWQSGLRPTGTANVSSRSLRSLILVPASLLSAGRASPTHQKIPTILLTDIG